MLIAHANLKLTVDYKFFKLCCRAVSFYWRV